jgi:hypothetical protein
MQDAGVPHSVRPRLHDEALRLKGKELVDGSGRALQLR